MIAKKWCIQLIFWWCLCLWSMSPFLTIAQNTGDPMSFPVLTNLVTDYSAVLDPWVLSWLNNDAFAIQQQTSAEIATVLFPNRNWHELFDIGMRLFRESGIWTAEKNNWLLLLIATEEKKLRIIVGYWLEWLFPDIWIRDLIETKLRPLVNLWQRQQAITLYHQSILERLQTEPEELVTNSEEIILTIRDLICFFVWWATTLFAFKSLRKKPITRQKESWPFWPFLWLLVLIILWLPWIIGAFFGYFFGLIFWSAQTPKSGRGNGQWLWPRWWWSSWWWSSWWFGGFGWWSSGWWGAGD